MMYNLAMSEFGKAMPSEVRKFLDGRLVPAPRKTYRGPTDLLIDKGEKAGLIPSISDLLIRKAQRRAFMAKEANLLPSISDLLYAKEARLSQVSTTEETVLPDEPAPAEPTEKRRRGLIMSATEILQDIDRSLTDKPVLQSKRSPLKKDEETFSTE